MRYLNSHYIPTYVALMRNPTYVARFDSKAIGAMYRTLMANVWRLDKEDTEANGYMGKLFETLANEYEHGNLVVYFKDEDLAKLLGVTERYVRELRNKLKELGLVDFKKVGKGGRYFYIVGEVVKIEEYGTLHEVYYIDKWLYQIEKSKKTGQPPEFEEKLNKLLYKGKKFDALDDEPSVDEVAKFKSSFFDSDSGTTVPDKWNYSSISRDEESAAVIANSGDFSGSEITNNKKYHLSLKERLLFKEKNIGEMKSNGDVNIPGLLESSTVEGDGYYAGTSTTAGVSSEAEATAKAYSGPSKTEMNNNPYKGTTSLSGGKGRAYYSASVSTIQRDENEHGTLPSEHVTVTGAKYRARNYTAGVSKNYAVSNNTAEYAEKYSTGINNESLPIERKEKEEKEVKNYPAAPQNGQVTAPAVPPTPTAASTTPDQGPNQGPMFDESPKGLEEEMVVSINKELQTLASMKDEENDKLHVGKFKATGVSRRRRTRKEKIENAPLFNMDKEQILIENFNAAIDHDISKLHKVFLDFVKYYGNSRAKTEIANLLNARTDVKTNLFDIKNNDMFWTLAYERIIEAVNNHPILQFKNKGIKAVDYLWGWWVMHTLDTERPSARRDVRKAKALFSKLTEYITDDIDLIRRTLIQFKRYVIKQKNNKLYFSGPEALFNALKATHEMYLEKIKADYEKRKKAWKQEYASVKEENKEDAEAIKEAKKKEEKQEEPSNRRIVLEKMGEGLYRKKVLDENGKVIEESIVIGEVSSDS